MTMLRKMYNETGGGVCDGRGNNGDDDVRRFLVTRRRMQRLLWLMMTMITRKRTIIRTVLGVTVSSFRSSILRQRG
jgi:hypothetical protein